MQEFPVRETQTKDGQGSGYVRRPRVVRAQQPGTWQNPGRQPLGRTEEVGEDSYAARRNRSQAAVPPAGKFPEGPQKGSGNEGNHRGKKKKKRKHRALYVTMILLCTMALGALTFFVAPQVFGITWSGLPNYAFMNGSIISLNLKAYNDYKAYRQYMEGNAIFPGVYVDGIHVGGMTVDQAKEALAAAHTDTSGLFSITVNIGNKSWVIDSGRVPLTRNYDQILAQAYALGRSNTTAIRGTGVTPFQERLNAALRLREEPVSLSTSMTYDKETVRALTDSIVDYVNRDPIDSMVTTFNFDTKEFTFSDDQAGAYVDGDDLYNKVIAALDGGDSFATLTIEPEIVLASTTKTELMNSFKLMASYTTKTTSNSNRNTNIELSANAINGTTLYPGDVFSFNEATGERTAAKGYKEASAISGGQSVPEVGGGVCQTSSTLFNAVARANLEIVYRSPHAWPSDYVEKGMDATVNWPNLDFKFKNNTDYPVFIVAYYEDRKVTVELYGVGLQDGMTIDLQSVVTRTIPAPEGTKYVLNTSLAPGETKDTVKARTGYVVETYQVWYKNGEEVSRNLLCTSTYKAYQKTVEYNE